MMAALRPWAWRIGRKLYCWGRSDAPNRPQTNGEYWLLEQYFASGSGATVVVDVGANRGEWSRRALDAAKAESRALCLYAFEPSGSTREILESVLTTYSEVEVLPLALSSRQGEADFFSSGVGAGTNSLDPLSGDDVERVVTSTLDRFAEERGIEHIGMVKVDTEGFDLEVLKGASGLLAAGRVEVLQFEYNWRWLLNHASLRDVFGLIADTPYRLGKLAGDKVLFYDQWHFELDRYIEANFVLARHGSNLERSSAPLVFNGHNVAMLQPID